MNQSSYTHPSFLEKLRLLRLHTMLEVGSLHCLDAINAMSTYNLDKIICIEPNPDCIALCRENIKNYKNISLIECAAWHEESSISFFPVVDSYDYNGKQTKNIGASSCYKSNGTWPYEKYIQSEIIVPARRLDNILNELKIPNIDFICMDAQGAELNALKGLGNYLNNVIAIITELEISPMYIGQGLFEDVYKYLTTNGFYLADMNMWASTAGDFLFLRTPQTLTSSTLYP